MILTKIVSSDLETRNHKVCSTHRIMIRIWLLVKFKIKELDPGFALQNVGLSPSFNC